MKTALVAPLFALVAAFAAPSHASSAKPPLFVAAVAASSADRVVGSGRIAEEPRAVAGFTALQITGPVDVQLKAAGQDAVTVRADGNIVPLIETRVAMHGDRAVLEIGVRPGAVFRADDTPLVIVRFRALSELVMRGSGDVHADRIEAEDFALSMSGSGSALIGTLQARRLAAVLSGSGDLQVSGGRVDDQAFNLAGSGDIDAGRLQGRRVQVSIAGSGDVAVNAEEALAASIAGSGEVIYRGSPRITQRVSGSGSVRRAH